MKSWKLQKSIWRYCLSPTWTSLMEKKTFWALPQMINDDETRIDIWIQSRYLRRLCFNRVTSLCMSERSRRVLSFRIRALMPEEKLRITSRPLSFQAYRGDEDLNFASSMLLNSIEYSQIKTLPALRPQLLCSPPERHQLMSCLHLATSPWPVGKALKSNNLKLAWLERNTLSSRCFGWKSLAVALSRLFLFANRLFNFSIWFEKTSICIHLNVSRGLEDGS